MFSDLFIVFLLDSFEANLIYSSINLLVFKQQDFLCKILLIIVV